MSIYDYVAALAVVVMLFLLFLILFERQLQYRITSPIAALDSEEYFTLLAALVDAQVHPASRIEVLSNGTAFYESELAAIRAARESIHLEGYIFEAGAVADQFLAALAERARGGVAVHIVIDAFGSFWTREQLFADLRKAGGKVKWYQPLRWYTFKRPLARKLSRRIYEDLLRGGVEIYEYQPAMIHTKCLLIDGLWSVVGSTNFDLRSFDHNDEINVAIRSPALTARLYDDFQHDLEQSHAVSLEEWERRPLSERLQAGALWVLKRQA